MIFFVLLLLYYKCSIHKKIILYRVEKRHETRSSMYYMSSLYFPEWIIIDLAHMSKAMEDLHCPACQDDSCVSFKTEPSDRKGFAAKHILVCSSCATTHLEFYSSPWRKPLQITNKEKPFLIKDMMVLFF